MSLRIAIVNLPEVPQQSPPSFRPMSRANFLCHFDRDPAPVPRCHFERAEGESRNLVSQQSFLYNGRMTPSRTYYVYIMSNQSRTQYVGFTNDIHKRVWEHRAGLVEGFTRRYKIDTLVYVESFKDVFSAIAREKQVKRWRWDKKLRLIAQSNPDCRDISDGS